MTFVAIIVESTDLPLNARVGGGTLPCDHDCTCDGQDG